jgi:hypothetical protein
VSVLGLDEVKRHLNLTRDVNDAELQDFIDSCEAAVSEKTGPLTSVATTERVSGGGCGLVLRATPVVSLTSVTPVNGSAYSLTLLDVDKSAGVIEWLSGARFQVGKYDVVFQAGRATVPDDLKLAIKDLIRDNWTHSQRGPKSRQGAGEEPMPYTAVAFSPAVMQKLNPHIQIGN